MERDATAPVGPSKGPSFISSDIRAKCLERLGADLERLGRSMKGVHHPPQQALSSPAAVQAVRLIEREACEESKSLEEYFNRISSKFCRLKAGLQGISQVKQPGVGGQQLGANGLNPLGEPRFEKHAGIKPAPTERSGKAHGAGVQEGRDTPLFVVPVHPALGFKHDEGRWCISSAAGEPGDEATSSRKPTTDAASDFGHLIAPRLPAGLMLERLSTADMPFSHQSMQHQQQQQARELASAYPLSACFPAESGSGNLLPASLRNAGQDPMRMLHQVWPDLISPLGEDLLPRGVRAEVFEQPPEDDAPSLIPGSSAGHVTVINHENNGPDTLSDEISRRFLHDYLHPQPASPKHKGSGHAAEEVDTRRRKLHHAGSIDSSLREALAGRMILAPLEVPPPPRPNSVGSPQQQGMMNVGSLSHMIRGGVAPAPQRPHSSLFLDLASLNTWGEDHASQLRPTSGPDFAPGSHSRQQDAMQEMLCRYSNGGMSSTSDDTPRGDVAFPAVPDAFGRAGTSVPTRNMAAHAPAPSALPGGGFDSPFFAASLGVGGLSLLSPHGSGQNVLSPSAWQAGGARGTARGMNLSALAIPSDLDDLDDGNGLLHTLA